uniref:Uncharacterized protein n=1 Tax=viral metagenome TaxID=1070528 RepID=A0A6C0BDQ4_9ZZZZ
MKININLTIKMSELNKTFVNIRLQDFLGLKYQLPKTVQIIPYAHIRSTDEIVAILTLNNLGVLTDFASSSFDNSNPYIYIQKNIYENSLGVIELSKEYIIENASISFVKSHDVSTNSDILFKHIPPVIFIRLDFERSEDLEELLIRFSFLFSKRIEGIVDNTTQTYNIIFINPTDLYYTCRGTTARRFDQLSGNTYDYDVKEDGFPADQRITTIYKSKSIYGDIPFGSNVNQFANCCPEVSFYRQVSSSLANSLLNFFDVELPILESKEKYGEVVVSGT